MSVNWLDIAIIVWLAASLISGLRMGFIYKLATTIGFFAGIWVASRYTPELAQRWNLGPIQMPALFFGIMTVVSRVFGLAGWILNKVFHLVAIIPFLKTFNRILGAALSVLLSVLIISSVLYVTNAYAGSGEISKKIQESRVASSLLQLSIFYKPLLSEQLNLFLDQHKEQLPTMPSVSSIDILMQ